MVFLIGENGHVVISAVYRIRYEYIADVINERIISENKKVFYFIFVTFKLQTDFFVLTDILPLSTLCSPWVPVLCFFPSCATEMLGCDNVTLTQGRFCVQRS